MNYDKIILGVDPGTIILGYGVLGIKGKNVRTISYGVIHLSKYKDYTNKFSKIFARISGLITEYNPDFLAIEAPFYGKNVQSMLKLGRVQGIVFAAAIAKKVEIFEYAPRKIKQSITGKGNASKEQVAGMIKSLTNMDEIPQYFDSTDALAAAFTHYMQAKIPYNNQEETKTYGSWEDFVKNNNKRVKNS